MSRSHRSSPGSVSCPVPNPPFAPVSLPTSWNRPTRSSINARSGSNCGNAPLWSCCSTRTPRCPTSRPDASSNCTPTRYATGAGVGRRATGPWETGPGVGASPRFPPLDEAIVKALACETVAQTKLPLSRQSLTDLAGRAQAALGRPISRRTVGRILDGDAIEPWRYEHWIFPRDPQFATKAGRVLDLYAGLWEGERLDPEDRILSADEKTSIQARIRCHESLGPGPRRPRRVEAEYERGGALQYLAAWDVQDGLVMGRCEARTGIVPFGRLVQQVMERPEYRAASRVFWVVDNGSSHRGEASVRRMLKAYPNAILVHLPVHASWLNQVEIYFSLVQRKVLTPNDFANLQEVESRLLLYEELSNRHPHPFDWRFDRKKLTEFLRRLAAKQATQKST